MNPPETASPIDGFQRTRLLQRRGLSPGTIEIDLERPEGFSFIAGQRIRLHRDGIVRDYSLVNGPDAAVLTLCIRLVKKGAFSRLLQAAPTGAAFDLSGPHGYFVFHPSDRPAVWVATGTGIAPFVAMCRAGISGTEVVHGVRNARQRYYADLLRENVRNYTACLSDARPEDRESFPGRVTRYLKQRLADGRYDFYLCGRREMIAEAILTVDDRFPGSRVYSEIFY